MERMKSQVVNLQSRGFEPSDSSLKGDLSAILQQLALGHEVTFRKEGLRSRTVFVLKPTSNSAR